MSCWRNGEHIFTAATRKSNPKNSRQALDADVPEGWITGEGEGEYAGLVYYYNEATGESTWDHPLDEFYRCQRCRTTAGRLTCCVPSREFSQHVRVLGAQEWSWCRLAFVLQSIR